MEIWKGGKDKVKSLNFTGKQRWGTEQSENKNDFPYRRIFHSLFSYPLKKRIRRLSKELHLFFT